MNVERKQIMSKVVLDSSALLALINNERVLLELKNYSGNIVMSSVNVAEVASTLSAILDNEERITVGNRTLYTFNN